MAKPNSAGLGVAFRRVLPWALFAALPVLLVVALLVQSHRRGILAIDFHNAYWPAGRSVLDGAFAYPQYSDLALLAGDKFVYPPLVAVLLAPVALVPRSVADILYTGCSIGAALLALRLFRVRDWRCYGLVFLWPPVLAATQAGNLTLFLVLLLGCLWRARDHAAVAGLVAALLVSAKLFLWPLVVWFLFARRDAAAALCVLFAVSLNAVAWIAVGAGSLTHYVDILRRLSDVEGPAAYTVRSVAADLGLPTGVGDGVTAAIVALLLLACWRARRDDRRSLALIVIVALVASPLVWLHYFALLIVPIALTRPTLAWPWFLPLALIFCPGTGNGTPLETGLALVVLALVAGSIFVTTSNGALLAAPDGERADPGPTRSVL